MSQTDYEKLLGNVEFEPNDDDIDLDDITASVQPDLDVEADDEDADAKGAEQDESAAADAIEESVEGDTDEKAAEGEPKDAVRKKESALDMPAKTVADESKENVLAAIEEEPALADDMAEEESAAKPTIEERKAALSVLPADERDNSSEDYFNVFANVKKKDISLDEIPSQFWSMDIYELAIGRHPEEIAFVPEGERTEELYEIMFDADASYFDALPEGMRTPERQYRSMLSAISRNPEKIRTFLEDEALAKGLTREMYLTALVSDPKLWSVIPKDVVNRDFCSEFIRRGFPMLSDRANPSFVTDCGDDAELKHKKREYVEQSLKEDENARTILSLIPDGCYSGKLFMKAVAAVPEALRDVPECMMSDDMCLAAVTLDPETLRLVPKDRQTEDFLKKAVASNSDVLGKIPEKLRTKEVCEVAVRKWGGALKWVPKELVTQGMCMLAACAPQQFDGTKEELAENGAFFSIPPEFKTKELFIRAIKSDGRALQYVIDEDEDILKAARESGSPLKNFSVENRDLPTCLLAVFRDQGDFECVPYDIRMGARNAAEFVRENIDKAVELTGKSKQEIMKKFAEHDDAPDIFAAENANSNTRMTL